MSQSILQCTLDACITESFPTTNYETGNLFIAGVIGSTDVRRAVIKFDLSGIPSDAVITSATLSMYFDQAESGGGSGVVQVSAYQCLKDWVESEVTWNIYSTGNSWAAAGGQSGADYDATAHGDFPAHDDPNDDGAGYEDCTLNATGLAYLQDIVAGTANNYGWFLIADNEGSSGLFVGYHGSENGSGNYPKLTVNYTVPVKASTYNIELRDRNGNLKRYLTPFVVAPVSWEWLRIGGCGRCTLTIKGKGYRFIDFEPMDDIQIRIKDLVNGGTKLVYRGYVAKVSPVLQIDQTITLECRGYYDLLKKIIVADTGGGKKTYTGMELSEIVDDIIDTYVTPNTDISKGTIDTSGYAGVDTIDFFASVDEALHILAECLGNVEFGVDENRSFFWRTESESIRRRFFVGVDVTEFERSLDFDDLLNKVQFTGGEDLYRTRSASDSQSIYFLSEEILNYGSVSSDVVADLIMSAALKERSNPKPKIRVKVPNTVLRLEDIIPLGKVEVYDDPYEQEEYVWGEAGDGGSDLTWGEAADGGSDTRWGGVFSAQVEYIRYELSDSDGRYNLEILLGDIMLEASAKLRRFERNINALIQR